METRRDIKHLIYMSYLYIWNEGMLGSVRRGDKRGTEVQDKEELQKIQIKILKYLKQTWCSMQIETEVGLF